MNITNNVSELQSMWNPWNWSKKHVATQRLNIEWPKTGTWTERERERETQCEKNMSSCAELALSSTHNNHRWITTVNWNLHEFWIWANCSRFGSIFLYLSLSRSLYRHVYSFIIYSAVFRANFSRFSLSAMYHFEPENQLDEHLCNFRGHIHRDSVAIALTQNCTYVGAGIFI